MQAIKVIVLLAALLIVPAARSGDITTGNLTVTNDAAVYGTLTFHTGPTNGAIATGGTISESGGYRIHTFTANGTFEVTGGPLVCDVLVVAGGGGGGESLVSMPGGGGGAGGYRLLSLSVSGFNSVVVGAGGGSHVAGGNSSFGNYTAAGGGRGCNPSENGGNGGSGGGGAGHPSGYSGGTGNTPPVTPSQGNNGGNGDSDHYNWTNQGGGGGAGTAGGNATVNAAGSGGAGTSSDISGTNIFYAGGGGGGVTDESGGTPGSGGVGGGGAGAYNYYDGSSGSANTGGGGGGAGGYGGNIGGSGGSGIVIVRYLISGSALSASSLTISSNGISQVNTSAVNSFLGKVGVGTESPEEKLHVSENVRIDGSLTFGGETRTNWPSGGGVAVGALIATNNLADLTDVAAARTNLGLGTAATSDASAFDAAGAAAAIDSALSTHKGDFNNPHKVTAAQVGALTPTGNGSQLTGITAGQVAGALIASNNLFDVADVTTARNNLGALSAAGGVVNGSLDLTGSIAAGVPGGDIPMGVYTNR